MKLQYRHNNGYDSVILIGESGEVRSRWTVDASVMRDYCNCSQGIDWDDQGGHEDVTPDDFGDLYAERTGHDLTIVDECFSERVEFFCR